MDPFHEGMWPIVPQPRGGRRALRKNAVDLRADPSNLISTLFLLMTKSAKAFFEHEPRKERA